MLITKEIRAYTLLTAIIICGLAVSTITASKVAHIGINFPFSNLLFSIFTYPLVDCICEIWGKKVAQQTVFIALGCQLFVALLLEFSIVIPHATYWTLQPEYEKILATSGNVAIASLLAFLVSQLLDILLYQRIKNASNGKHLWLRSNVSTIIGQFIDSSIFISIVFYSSHHKLDILFGSMSVKFLLSLLMTPFVYVIVIAVDRYLESNTLAFKRSIA